MKKLLIGLLVFGLTTQFMFSQVVELAEVHLDVNYKYLNAIESQDVAVPVKNLEKKVAFYDLKASAVYNDPHDSYQDVYGTYRVQFAIPEGTILAIYDKEGKITRTIERFKNIELPNSILMAVAEQYPNWNIEEDSYKVDYYGKSGIAIKQYNIKLKNEKKRKTVKLDANGEYL